MNYRLLLIFIFVFFIPIKAVDVIDSVSTHVNMGGTVRILDLPHPDFTALPVLVAPYEPVPEDLSDATPGPIDPDDTLHPIICSLQTTNFRSVTGVIDSQTVIPPDTMGAVGPNHLVITINDRVAIQDRNGNLLKVVSLNSFWSSLGNPNAFDPRIAYDPFANRWIISSSANPESATSSLLVGVSRTGDPTGLWNLYRLDVDAANLVWLDQPTLGFNKNWVVVQGNMFNVSNSAFNRTHIYVFNKANLYAGLTALLTLFTSSTIGGSQVPAQTYDANLGTEYLLQNWNGNSGGKGFLRLYALTGTVNAPVLSAIGFPTSLAPWSSSTPTINKGFAPQAQTPLRIATNDARIGNVVYRNGSIWGAQTVFLPAGAPTRSAAQWWQISPSAVVQQRGRIETPTATATNGGFFYAYPSIAVNSRNDALVGYSRFSSTTFASAGFSFRLAADAPNTMRTPQIFQAGLATYTKDFGSGSIRWGDYSNSVVDPINDRDFWTIQEYAASHTIGGTSRWGVIWGSFTTPMV